MTFLNLNLKDFKNENNLICHWPSKMKLDLKPEGPGFRAHLCKILVFSRIQSGFNDLNYYLMKYAFGNSEEKYYLSHKID